MRYTSFFALIVSISVMCCTKEVVTPRAYPRVVTNEVTGISSSGAAFNGEVTFANVPILDHGFIWSDRSNFTPSQADKISLGGRTGNGAFTAPCNFALKVNQQYFVRSYVISEDYAVYGDVIVFTSLGANAPAITRFYPASATWTDTIAIIGKNFTAVKNSITVKFNLESAFVLQSSPDTILVTVPVSVIKMKSTITLSMLGYEAKASEEFVLKSPKIQTLSPSTGTVGSTVSITGSYIDSPGTKIYFDDVRAAMIGKDHGSLLCVVPAGIRGGNIVVKVVTGEGELFDTIPFQSEGPYISGISPQNVAIGQELKIIGDYFSLDPSSNAVTFDGVAAQVTAATKTEITVIAPSTARINPTIKVSFNNASSSFEGFRYAIPEITSFSITPIDFKSYEISMQGINFQDPMTISIGDQPLTLSSIDLTEITAALPGMLQDHGNLIKIQFYNESIFSAERVVIPWAPSFSFPGNGRQGAVTFSHNGKAFVGLGQSTKELWMFDPNGSQWTIISDFPGTPGENMFATNIGSKAYIGGGHDPAATSSEAYEYDIVNNTWRRVADLPFATGVSSSFTINNIPYVIQDNQGSIFSKLWRYDNINDIWLMLGDCPAGLYEKLPVFVVGESAYIFGLVVYQYNAAAMLWSEIAGPAARAITTFSIDGVGYAISSNSLYQFNNNTNNWIEKRFIYTPSSPQPAGFSLAGKGYYIIDGQMAEYDPSLE